MLPRANRLTEKLDFENVRQNGKFVSMKFFSVSILDRGDKSTSRFGFIVSKKISTKANERNKVKRMLREIVRRNLMKVKNGFDFVVITKRGIIEASDATIEKQLMSVII